MEEKENVLKKAYGKLIFACMFLYCVSMATKNIYTAEIIEIIDVFGVTRAQANLSNTFYYITYAIAQIVLSVFYNKINIKRFIGITTLISALLITSIFFAKSLAYCWIIFGLNGIFTAGLYSGCVTLFTKYLPRELLPKVNKILSTLGVGANILSYGIAAFCVGFLKWNFGFAFLGVVFIIACISFIVLSSSSIACIKKHKQENVIVEEKKESAQYDYIELAGKKDKVILYVLNLILIFFANALYFALSSWFSDILYTVYNVPKAYSMLITIVMPIVIIIGPILVINYSEKRRNLYLNSVFFYALPILIPLFLYFFYDFNLFGAIIIILAYTIVLNGARILFSTLFAFHMKGQVHSGSYTAIMNASASVAAGVSPTVVGYIADIGGWGLSFLSLFSVNAFMVVGSLVALLIFKNKIRKREKGV